jgi:phosphatidate cytidylyltransferase
MQHAKHHPEEPETPAMPRRSSLGLRTLTVCIGLPIVLAFVWLGGWAMFALLGLVLVLMTLELRSLMRRTSYQPSLWFSLLVAFFLLVLAMFPQQRPFLLEIGIGVVLLLSFPLLFSRLPAQHALSDWGLTLAFAFYLGWPLSCLLLLRGDQAGQLHALWADIPRGVWWVLLVLLGTWSFDTGAFYIGRAFRGHQHPLAAQISPGKNWEGLIGGTCCAVMGCILLTRPLDLPWYQTVLLGIVLGCAGMCGDMSESFIKRQAHAKDSGTMLPGHGGILDRCDSILFGSVIVYIFSMLVGG